MTSFEPTEPPLPKQFRRPRVQQETSETLPPQASAPLSPPSAPLDPNQGQPIGAAPRRQTLAERQKGFHFNRGLVVTLIATGLVIVGSSMPWFHDGLYALLYSHGNENVFILGIIALLATLLYAKVPSIMSFWVIVATMTISVVLCVTTWFDSLGGVSNITGTHQLAVAIDHTSAGFVISLLGSIAALFAINAGRKAARGY